nr:EOG090X08OG [Artemia franciscana]
MAFNCPGKPSYIPLFPALGFCWAGRNRCVSFNRQVPLDYLFQKKQFLLCKGKTFKKCVSPGKLNSAILMQVLTRITDSAGGGDQNSSDRDITRSNPPWGNFLSLDFPSFYFVELCPKLATPPRIITLNDETFKITEDDISEKITVKAKNQSRTEIRDTGVNVTRKDSLTRSQSMASLSGVSDTTEEIDNLRRQISRMNRRLMTLELENQHRQNREFVMYTLGFGYFLLKALLWLSRKN